MLIHKSQIRPRFKHITLTNAEVLSIPTATEGSLGVGMILIPGLPNTAYVPRLCLMRFNGVQPVTGIDDGSYLAVTTEDFVLDAGYIVEDSGLDPAATQISKLFAPTAGNVSIYPGWGPEKIGQGTTAMGLYTALTVESPVYKDTELPIGAGLMISSDNALAYTGGDPLNTLELFLEYWIINL